MFHIWIDRLSHFLKEFSTHQKASVNHGSVIMWSCFADPLEVLLANLAAKPKNWMNLDKSH
jgi:hypothetical protein